MDGKELNTKNSVYISTLTPLRGIAALFVVLHHSNIFFGSFVSSAATRFFDKAWIWVDFFFILSGFILSYSYGKYFETHFTRKDYKKYLVARFARIFPIHLVTLLWSFAVVATIVYLSSGIDATISDSFNLKAFLPCLLLVQDLHLYKLSPLNFPSWSLSAEWWMYLIFPLIMPCFTNLATQKKILFVLLLFAGYLALIYGLGPVSGAVPDGKPKINLVMDFGMLRCMVGFCTGMLLCTFYTSRSGYNILKQSWCFLLIFAATLFAVHADVMDVLIVALFPFLLLAAAYNETIIKRIMDNYFLQRLGDWSFSIYMTHAPIILMMLSVFVYRDPKLLSNVTSSAGGGGYEEPNYKMAIIYSSVVVIATVFISSITYRFIEVPAGKYLRKVAGKKVLK